MRRDEGFTLLEIIVVVGILALATAIAVPNMINWRMRAQLRGAAENLKMDIQRAKARAAREATSVTIQLDPADNSYRIYFQRSGEDEQTVMSKTLAAGVYFDESNDEHTIQNNKTSFNARGTGGAGSIVLANSVGERKKIVIFLGKVSIDSL